MERKQIRRLEKFAWFALGLVATLGGTIAIASQYLSFIGRFSRQVIEIEGLSAVAYGFVLIGFGTIFFAQLARQRRIKVAIVWLGFGLIGFSLIYYLVMGMSA